MSTRSGKRIHGLILEEGLDNLVEQKSVRKTRNNQDQENVEITFTNKKRKNYVRYPSEEDIANDLNGNFESVARSTRKLTRNTLKEQNLLTTEFETSNDERKIVRVTRRTKMFDIGDSSENAQLNIEVKPTERKKKVKKNKIKKSSITEENTNIVPSVVDAVTVTKKKSNKKKKKSKSNSMTVDDIPQNEEEEQKNLNKSITSIDSFHSAADSPLKGTLEKDQSLRKETLESDQSPRKETLESDQSPRKETLESGQSSIKDTLENDKFLRIRRNKKYIESGETTMPKEKSNRKCQLTAERELETFTEIQTNDNLSDNNTNIKHLNNTFKSISKRKSSVIQNSLNEQNMTFEAEIHGPLKNSEKKRKSNLSLYQTDMNDTKINGSYEILKTNSTSKRKTYSIENQLNFDLNGTFERGKINESGAVIPEQLGSSSKKPKPRTNLDSTYDMEKSNEFNHSLVASIADNNISKRKSSFKDSTYDKIENTSIINLDDTYDNEKINQFSNHNTGVVDLQKPKKSIEPTSLNSSYDKTSNTASPIILNNTLNNNDKINTTYDKEKPQKDSTFDNSQRKSSIISSDTTNSTSDMTEDNSRISITSDESKENIVNTTLVLIESSLDESQIANRTPLKRQGTFTTDSPVSTPLKRESTYTEIKPQTPQRGTPKPEKTVTKGTTLLKKDGTYTEIRTATPTKKEGTFTKDKDATPLKRDGTYTEIKSTTPLKREGTYTDFSLPNNSLQREGTFTKDESPKPDKGRRKSLPSPGCTPFPNPKRSKEKNLNITHSIEKRKSIIDIVPRTTKVMFCSPVNNPGVVTQMKRKIIKSNLKGSNKSFVFNESVSDINRSGRKRSYTQSEAEHIGNKRKRLTEDQQQSVDRLARPRTTSASARLQGPSSPKKTTTPTKSKPSRSKLPNFAVLHQKQFEKMESLDECQERKAKRARTLLTPTGSVTVLERISPKETNQPEVPKKADTPKKQNHQYTRFGFKLNMDVNPFSVIKNTEPKKQKPPPLKRQATLPSLHGATVRKNMAKLAIMREKSFTEKRTVDRKENRTVIKGVRTNRRFELQMKMRNIDK